MSIVIEHLNYVYMAGGPYETKALSDVNLTIGDGEFVGLIGHTGSGKSTLVQHLNGLLMPSGGRILVDGMDLSDKATDRRAIRQRVGLVFQYPENQLFEETVEKDIAFGPKNLGLDEAEIDRRVRLAMKPDVIILDESTAMLDPSGRQEVMNTVHRLNREEGISVVIITHYMSEAATADYVVVMDGGRIAMSGTPREVFTQVDRVRALGLDVPPMTDLAHMLRESGVDVRADVLTVDEMVEEVCRLSSNI